MCGTTCRRQALDDARPLPQPGDVAAVLDAVLEQHLQADADPEHRAAAGQPAVDRRGRRRPS
jgi:hypothetical protein